MTTLYKCNCGNHFTFPKSAIPSLLPQPTPPALPPAPPPSLPVVLPTQLPSQPLASSISRTKCGNHPCGRVAHRSCLNHMCKQCCIICAGGCHLADHKTSRLSTRQQEKLQVALPTPYFLPVPDPRPRSPTSISDALDGLYSSNPTTIFLGQEGRINEVKQVEEQRQVDLKAREEADYQMAIAQSLDLPYMAPTTSTTLPTSSISRLSGHSAPQPTPRNVSNITQHMNKDWMRPVEDKTKIPRRPNREGGDNCFTIIFWDKVRILANVLHQGAQIHLQPGWGRTNDLCCPQLSPLAKVDIEG